ncbi:efflux RND transporter periplasmic adaptor subunit [Chitinophaga sp. 212800010-3]|uniref:efflux RND transporter periplasmic adaptor subunit n=1 Tax=unclassified Chitinophaga TaxID=2619133 RepID=UPI002DE55BBE|nr:hypothetical protein [Chitinophaga sp. 212800010-3]
MKTSSSFQQILIPGITAIVLQACSTGQATLPPEKTVNIFNDTTSISYFKLTRKNFHKELVCNGKLSARRKAQLRFRQAGQITAVNLQNGMHVEQGQVIASLDRNRLANALEARKIHLAQSRLDYEDRLLTMGYNAKDSASLPPGINQAALIRSGYKQNMIELSEAAMDYDQAEIRAPFAGIIAGLDIQPYNMSDTYSKGCLLIDDSEFIVDFNVMESELPFIKASQEVSVSPFNDPILALPGRIVAINPVVEETGLISVRALVPNKGRQLLDGMNVRIKAQQQLKRQLVVPKTAIVERQGRKVVFTYEGGYAIWHYVETGTENSEFSTILSGLQENDNIISKGSFNLAHHKPVKAMPVAQP